ncbi:MAG TPA: alpha/beta hydrolase [Gaiellaceae bacterium]
MVPLVASLALAVAPIHVERGLHYGPGPQQTLDAYVVSGSPRAVVLIHGGGFHSGSKESLDATALRFAQSGWSAFSISYRLVPPAPWYAAKDDALAAVRWVRAHSREFGLDPQRLVVFGTSAGGNLAALAATVGRGRSLVAAAASWSGPMDLTSFARTSGVIHRYAGCSCASRLRSLSPVSFVGASDAPLLLASSTHELVPLDQATEMARRLRGAGIPHRLIVYPGTRHSVAYERDAWAPTLRFLDAWTRPADPPAGFRVYTRGAAGGEIWRGAIPGAVRASMIYVPPGYSPSRRYPVVYLLPGMPGSPWSYVKSLSLASVADTLIARGRTRPFVAVMPVAGPSGHYDGEWAGPWEDYLVRRVIPWVDAHLAVSRDRAIAGLSAGGYGAVDIALRHPRLFRRVASWGGYFAPFRDGPLRGAPPRELASHDPDLLARTEAPLLRRLGTRFFVSSGPGHGRITKRATVRFAGLLRTLRLPFRLRLLGEKRGAWERQLVDGLAWAEAAPQP